MVTSSRVSIFAMNKELSSCIIIVRKEGREEERTRGRERENKKQIKREKDDYRGKRDTENCEESDGRKRGQEEKSRD